MPLIFDSFLECGSNPLTDVKLGTFPVPGFINSVNGAETSVSGKLSARSITKTALDATVVGSSEEKAAADPIKSIKPPIVKTDKASNAAKNDLKKLFIKMIDCEEI